MIQTSDIPLYGLIQRIQGNRIATKGEYTGSLKQNASSKIPSVVYTLLQRIRELDPALLSQVKVYDCLTAWAVASDIARIEADLPLCPQTSSLALHGRRKALALTYTADTYKAKTRISDKPCNSQFCPFCAVRRVEQLEALNITDYSKYEPFFFCYGSFLAASYTDKDINHSIAQLSKRSKEHKLICGIRKLEYQYDTNRITMMDYVLGTRDAKRIAGYTPLVDDPNQYNGTSSKAKTNAFTMLMPCAATILQLMRLDPNVLGLLKHSQRSGFRIYETHGTAASEASDGAPR